MAAGTNVTISDQVWDQLDPYAARLSAQDRHRAWAAVGGATAIAVAVAALWWSGLLVPRLSFSGQVRAIAPRSEPTFTIVLVVKNDTPFTIHLRSAGRSGSGLQIIDTETASQLTSGTAGKITLHYRVTNCSAVPSGSWPVPVRVERLWGQSTVWVAGSLQLSNPDSDGDDDPDPWEIPWQQAMAQIACSGKGGGEDGIS